jgi:hypothetical protein
MCAGLFSEIPMPRLLQDQTWPISQRSNSFSLAPIVVRRIGYAIWTGGKEVVTIGMFSPGAAVNVIVPPRIFRILFEQLIPPAWFRLGIRLRHECLEALLGCRVKSVHAFVELQLRPNRLNIGSDRRAFRESSWISNFGDRQSQKDNNDANHDHDLEKGEATVLGV